MRHGPAVGTLAMQHEDQELRAGALLIKPLLQFAFKRRTLKNIRICALLIFYARAPNHSALVFHHEDHFTAMNFPVLRGNQSVKCGVYLFLFSRYEIIIAERWRNRSFDFVLRTRKIDLGDSIVLSEFKSQLSVDFAV